MEDIENDDVTFEIGYKVVTITNDGEMISSSQPENIGGIVYKQGKNFPKDGLGPLTLFTNETAARIYGTYLFCPFKILKVKYIPSKSDAVWDTVERMSIRNMMQCYRYSFYRIKFDDIALADCIIVE